ncbi:MAG: NADPH-dependent 7-cyano-7-deazaguanine reductase QueF [bacterium]|nr:MAG: NADPH-dependent 7-cyano-7-deazaguanine reductase QueF [bacterium]
MEKKEQKYKKLTILRESENKYPESPDEATLETFENRYSNRDYWITFDCPEFTSRCPITNQPDFGSINIRYIPDKQCIESKSLKLYLFSFRNYGTFHEEAVNRILDDIVAACQPRRVIVSGDFNPRGGISIKVEAEYSSEQNR